MLVLAGLMDALKLGLVYLAAYSQGGRPVLRVALDQLYPIAMC